MAQSKNSQPQGQQPKFNQNRVAGLKNAACYLCDSEDTTPYWSGFNRVNKDRRWDVVKCGRCGLVFMSPVPSAVEERLRELPPYHRFTPGTSRHTQVFLEDWESSVLRHTARRRLLDVGFGNGDFWRAAREAGWDAYGVEIQEATVAAAREFYQTDRLIAGRIDELPSLFTESFDIVNLSETLEHLTDPLNGIRAAAQVLRPGGLLTIDVPNVQFVMGWFDREHVMDVPAHLSYWSSATLARALEKCGLRVVEMTSGFGLETLFGRVSAPQTTARIARRLRRIGRSGRGVRAVAEVPAPGGRTLSQFEGERVDA